MEKAVSPEDHNEALLIGGIQSGHDEVGLGKVLLLLQFGLLPISSWPLLVRPMIRPALRTLQFHR